MHGSHDRDKHFSAGGVCRCIAITIVERSCRVVHVPVSGQKVTR